MDKYEHKSRMRLTSAFWWTTLTPEHGLTVPALDGTKAGRPSCDKAAATQMALKTCLGSATATPQHGIAERHTLAARIVSTCPTSYLQILRVFSTYCLIQSFIRPHFWITGLRTDLSLDWAFWVTCLNFSLFSQQTNSNFIYMDVSLEFHSTV